MTFRGEKHQSPNHFTCLRSRHPRNPRFLLLHLITMSSKKPRSFTSHTVEISASVLLKHNNEVMWQCGSFYTLWIIVILLISFWINRFNPPGGLSNRTNVPPSHVWASCGAILKSAAGFVAVHSDDPEAKWQTSPCPKPTDVQSGQTCPRFWRRQVLGLPSFLVKSMSLTAFATAESHQPQGLVALRVVYCVRCIDSLPSYTSRVRANICQAAWAVDRVIAVTPRWVLEVCEGFSGFMPMRMFGNCSILCNFDFNLLAKFLLLNKNFYHTLTTNARLLWNRWICKLPQTFLNISFSQKTKSWLNHVESTFHQLISRLGLKKSFEFFKLQTLLSRNLGHWVLSLRKCLR